MPYDVVAFDFDGVLMDLPEESFDEHLMTVAEQALHRYGIDDAHPAYDRLYDAICDRSMDEIEVTATSHGFAYEEIWAAKEAVSFERQQKQIQSGERVFYDDITALPELAAHCDIAVFSNNQHDLIDHAMHQEAPQLNGTGSLATVVETYYGIQPTVDDHFNRKPAPTYIEQIREELDADRMLYVGDKSADIMAAHSAGADSVFIRRSHNNGTDNLPTDADGNEPTYGPIDTLDEIISLVADDR